MGKYRLSSKQMFSRNEEDNKEEPRRIVFLSVEGNVTEIDYLNHLEVFREELNINSYVHIHPLRRRKNDTQSAPEKVLDLLEEYIDLRNEDDLPSMLKASVINNYSIDFINDYLYNNNKIDNSQREAI